MLFTAMLWLLSCQLFAATITAEDLRGDDNFINKILSLQKEDNTVVDNAIYVATDEVIVIKVLLIVHMKQFTMLFQRLRLDKQYMLEVVHTTKILLLQNPVQRVTILQ